jgi:sortase A
MLDRRLSWTWLERSLGALTLASLGFCVWARLDADFYQSFQASRLQAILKRTIDGAAGWSRRSGGTMAVATRAESQATGLIGRLEIPRLGVAAIVAEGTDSRTLRRAVGHIPRTPLPGEAGNVVLAGHRDSFFRSLRHVLPGDLLRMTTPDGVFDYRIESTRVVRPEDTEVLSATPSPTLTLITCYPFGYVGPAPERFVVRARATSPAPAPSS